MSSELHWEIRAHAGMCSAGGIIVEYFHTLLDRIGVPGGIRTPDLPLRRGLLYPAELPEHSGYWCTVFVIQYKHLQDYSQASEKHVQKRIKLHIHNNASSAAFQSETYGFFLSTGLLLALLFRWSNVCSVLLVFY